MSVLSVLSGLSTAAGQGFQGYGQDEQIKVKDTLAQAKAADEAARNRVLNLVGMAGIDPTTQGKIAGARAQAEVAPHISEAAGKVKAETQPLIDRANAMIPTEANKAGAIAQATAPIQQATHLANRQVDLATEPDKVVGGMGPDGKPVFARVGQTGAAKPIEGLSPKEAGGGAGDVMAKRASAAIPQIDTALKNFDQYHEPGAAGRLFARSPLGGYTISPEGQLANQAATAIAQAYAGAKSRSGVPSATSVHDIASQILIQPGEAGNPALVSAKIARAHAWRDELMQLSGSNKPAGSGGADPEFDALMSSLTPKKKP